LKNKAYKPLPYRDGNRVVNEYVEHFQTKLGFRGIITLVDYTDKKNKLHERFTMFVRWL